MDRCRGCNKLFYDTELHGWFDCYCRKCYAKDKIERIKKKMEDKIKFWTMWGNGYGYC